MHIVMSFPFRLIIRVTSGVLKWQIAYNISGQIKIYVVDDALQLNYKTISTYKIPRGCLDKCALHMRFDRLLIMQPCSLQNRTRIRRLLSAGIRLHQARLFCHLKGAPCMLLSSILSDCPLGGAENEMRRSLESSVSCSADSAGVTDIVHLVVSPEKLSSPLHTHIHRPAYPQMSDLSHVVAVLSTGVKYQANCDNNFHVSQL